MSHTFKDIAVFFDRSEAGVKLLDLAAQIARSQGAHLVGLTAAQLGHKSIPAEAFVKGGAISDLIQRMQRSMAVDLMESGRLFAHSAARYGVSAEFRVLSFTELGEDVSLRSLICDMLVVGRASFSSQQVPWSYADVLKKTGVPILIVPQSWTGPRFGQHVTVGWNASRQSRRAIADAIPLLLNAEAVDLVIVDSDKDREVYGPEPGSDIATYLSRHEVHVEVHRKQSCENSVADTLLDHAVRAGSDLLVVGAYSQSRLMEVIRGGVTSNLVDHELPMPLFISH